MASPEELEVLAITTVAGNVPVELTSKNARKALELAKRTDIPVYASAAAPLVRALVTAEHDRMPKPAERGCQRHRLVGRTLIE